ncbi:hypothetical protein EV363DRAFT_1170118 [Boletus edulis]|uniref:MICOS complex subunit MIC12 n=1 Tax=Boletus edulis BED1 TaxID=1328754 RepID=A0AAD4C996_BOLED|nr:hypothetical protein EV363DRAFT_1170118 [Boletus edulis]KAF8415549.1 hypothetical protein L210DRAFT_3431144 [Boletus edulis BED1]KAF8452577.1 hypothetical protein L210DRAFT_3383875 [Boletus edulis BED1]
MSFLVGSLAGAVATGGVYYGFSNLMQTRTAQHRHDLHHLATRLVDATATLPGPLPASKRIVEHPLKTMVQAQWNEHVASIYSTVGQWERDGSEWARKVLYGEA